MYKKAKATPPPLNNMIYDANGLLFRKFLQGSSQSLLRERLGPILAPLMRSTPFVEIETDDTSQSFIEIAKIPEEHGKNNIAYLSVGTDAMAWYLWSRCGATSLQIKQCHPGQCVVVSRVIHGHMAACSTLLYLPHLRPLDFPAMTPIETAVDFLKCREG